MAEISHPEIRNFLPSEWFQYIEASGSKLTKKAAMPRGSDPVTGSKSGGPMRYLKYVALLAVLMVPFAYSQAQVAVGIGVGVGPGYAAGPPVCAYGYYNYYPYACAPYGYYGPSYFVDGIFIGAGPWYHWGHPAWFWNRGYVGRGWDWGHDRFYARGYRPGFGYGRGYVRGYAHPGYGHAYVGGGVRGGFHGGEFHGGGFHGGGRR